MKDKITPFFLPALFFRFSCGIGVGLLYAYYYQGGDTFTLFSEASKLSDLLYEYPKSFSQFILYSKENTPVESLHLLYIDQPRALFTVKILSFISFLTFKNYWISSLWLSFFSFCGMWSLVKTLTCLFSKTFKAAVFSFLFLPSSSFFGSGITKESICLGCIGFIVSQGLLFAHKRVSFIGINAVLRYLLILLSTFTLLKIKFYVVVILIFILLIYWIIKLTPFGKNKKTKKFALIFFLFLTLTYFSKPHFYTNTIPETVAASYNKIFTESKRENLTFQYPLQPSWASILKKIPEATVWGLFRPVIGESGNIWMILAETENLFLFFIIFSALFYCIRKQPSFKLEAFLCIFYIIFMACILGLTVPNVGTLFRHKSVFLPFLWLLGMLGTPFLGKIRIRRTD